MRFLGLLLALSAATAGCSTPPPPRPWVPTPVARFDHPLTLAECLGIARASDLRVAEWTMRREAASTRVRESGALPDPVLGLGWEGLGLHGEGGSLVSRTATVTWPLLFWWTRPRKLAVARAQEQTEIEVMREQTRQLVLDVGLAYFEVAAHQRLCDAASAACSQAQEGVRWAEGAERAGLRTGQDVHRARTEALAAVQAEAAAGHRLRQARAVLAFLLGADRPVWPEVAAAPDPASRPQDQEGAESPASVLVEEVLARDPSFARARAEVRVAERECELERRNQAPFSLLTGSVGSKSEPGPDSGQAGLEIPIPLFDGGRESVYRADVALQAARIEEEKTRRRTIAALTDEWEKRIEAVENWRRFSVPLRERRELELHAAQRLYESGSGDYGDVLAAQRDWIEARREEAQAWQSAVAADWELRCALGAEDPEPLAP